MDIDIIILTKADRGISKETLNSLVQYAPEDRVILGAYPEVNWSTGEKLSKYRLLLARKAVADWVYFLDDDDTLLQSFFRIKENSQKFRSFDYILFSLYDKEELQSIRTCSPNRLFGFHMILAKKDVAIRALLYANECNFWREDTAYCIWLIEHCKGAEIKGTLVQKNGDRLPFDEKVFRRGSRQEVRSTWRYRLQNIRRDTLPITPTILLGEGV